MTYDTMTPERPLAGTTVKCRRCGYHKMKRWRELIGDEKILAEKLPMSAEFEPSARKKHLFCMRCWYEDTGSAPVTA